jgi:CheY-like chemotaxis protein
MRSKLAVLIDNDVEDLAMLEGAMRETSPNLTCISCIFPDEAIHLINHFLTVAPDYIFIDVNMSRMTGPECLTSLKMIESLSDCKIIMFSGVMPPAVGEAFKKLGASDYFQKPILGSQYRTALSKIFDKQGSANQMSPS